MLRRGLVILVMLGGALLASPAMAAATQESGATPAPSATPRFTISAAGDQSNAWFDVTIGPGETANLIAAIHNVGDEETTVLSYATNARSSVNGGFSAASSDEEPTGPTLWLNYPHEMYDLPADGVQEIEFTIRVPEGTQPGRYVAALVVQTPDPLDIPGSEIFAQIIRSAISVEITVPGEAVATMELGVPTVTHTASAWSVDVPISNTGTARLRPQGELVLTTPDGVQVAHAVIEMGWVYSGTNTSIRVSLPGQLPAGDYLVTVDVADEPTGASASFAESPVTFVEEEETPVFDVSEAAVTPNGDPIQYADVAATIANNGDAIPTANVTLNVLRDGEDVESYPLAQNQALPRGTTDFGQRYIPVDGWEQGTYTFELVISAVSGGTETILATVEFPDEIVVP